jgi:hypothetical protein
VPTTIWSIVCCQGISWNKGELENWTLAQGDVPARTGKTKQSRRRIRGRCFDLNFLRNKLAIFSKNNVMITIFCEKIGVFLKKQCYDHIFAKLSIRFSKKRQYFC